MREKAMCAVCYQFPILAHHAILPEGKIRSQSGDSGHSPTYRRLDPVTIDAQRTFTDVEAAAH
jgi:hypothetical protein